MYRVSTLLKSVFGKDEQRGGTYSERTPIPKSIGGPLTGLGEAATSFRLGLGGFLSGFQESTARTIVGGLEPVFGEGAPLDISAPARAGDYGGALTQLPSSGLQYTGEKVIKPITEAGQALTLPLLAVAGILLLK